MLLSAAEHYRRQRRIVAAGLSAAQGATRRGPLAVAQVVAQFQFLAALDAVDAVPQMLQEQGISPDPVGAVATTSLIGVASDGRPLDTLFAQAQSPMQLGLMVVTQLQDAARLAASVSMVNSRGAGGYVRMLTPPSCSRCAILAGKFYRWNAGFKRHPRCDCRHIPSNEALWHDVATNPNDYFESLSPAEQDKFFTKAGAQAIRDGADMSQVVNARAGMAEAQVPGVGKVVTTTTGTTKRAWFGGGHAARQMGDRATFDAAGLSTTSTGQRGFVKSYKVRRTNNVRLMPESIYRLAGDDRDKALHLLEKHGYLIGPARTTPRREALALRGVGKAAEAKTASVDVRVAEIAAAAKAANPHFGEHGYDENCASCVTAYESIRRGFNREAVANHSGEGISASRLLESFGDSAGATAELVAVESRAEFEQLVNGWPDGARGFVTLEWADPLQAHLPAVARRQVQHVCAVERVGDSFVLVEPQRGVLYDSDDFFSRVDADWLGAARVDHLGFTPKVAGLTREAA